MIEVEQLRKEYGEFVAVDEVSFTARAGEIFGLLGPNGAGKSTTISCISGILEPTSGRISVMGHDVVSDGVASRKHLGVVPQELAIYEDLSATENLNYWGGAYGLRGDKLKTRVQEVLWDIGLLDRAKEPSKNFSGGMKRRLNFGCAVVHEPKILLLDEPTVGVDPQSREKLFDLVQAQVEAGTCVLYTTHYMEEAEKLCNRLAIVDHGKIIAHGTLNELRNMLGERDLVRLSGQFNPDKVNEAFQERDDVDVLIADETNLQLSVSDGSQKLPDLFAALNETGARIGETTLSRPNLESLFIKLTGKELRE